VVAAVTKAGGAISLLVGIVLLRLTLSGTFERYVREGMAPWLLAAGAAVLVLGAATLVQALRNAPVVDAHDHHEHGGGLGVGWLLLAPIAALLLVAPPTLGAYGIGRAASVDIRAGAPVFDPLPKGSGPVEMTLLEYGQRAFDHAGSSLAGEPVQLTGFVADSEPGGFRLARYQIACCAADAAPVVVRVVGTSGDALSRDQWVTVVGRYRPTGDEQIPALTATSVVEIEPPNDPYE
jgi:uncharacterized repeat protein (TIGR03943 family)